MNRRVESTYLVVVEEPTVSEDVEVKASEATIVVHA